MGYFKVKAIYSTLILSLIFPVFAFGAGLMGGEQTASALMAEIGTVSSSTFGGVLPYALLSMGVFLAFYIIQQIVLTQPKDKKDRIIRDKKGKQVGFDVSNDGYHRIIGKDGQEKGWAKD